MFTRRAMFAALFALFATPAAIAGCGYSQHKPTGRRWILASTLVKGDTIHVAEWFLPAGFLIVEQINRPSPVTVEVLGTSGKRAASLYYHPDVYVEVTRPTIC